jgi:hypothetical protein
MEAFVLMEACLLQNSAEASKLFDSYEKELSIVMFLNIIIK